MVMSDDDENLKQGLGDIFAALTTNFDKESKEIAYHLKDNELIVDALDALENNKFEEFYISLQYPFDKLVNGVVDSVITNRDAQFIMKHSQFLERHFNKLIDQYEGMGCRADKTRTLIRSLLVYYATGKEIEFDYNAEYTYHLPKVIFTTHDEIIEFYEAVKNIYYGDVSYYLKALSAILTKNDVTQNEI